MLDQEKLAKEVVKKRMKMINTSSEDLSYQREHHLNQWGNLSSVQGNDVSSHEHNVSSSSSIQSSKSSKVVVRLSDAIFWLNQQKAFLPSKLFCRVDAAAISSREI